MSHRQISKTYRPFNVRSDSFPFTLCPTPVPLTLNPFSALLRSLSSVPFTVWGNKSSTPYCLASFTNSACLRNENTGSCHLPVTGCFCALKGEGTSNPSWPTEIWSADEAVDSESDVFDSGAVEVGAVEDALDWERMAWGGYRAKKRVNRGGSDSASLMYCRECSAMIVMAFLRLEMW
jgi:hypothetical protein